MPAVVIAVCLCTSRGWAQTARWPEQKASAWYARQPWLVGSNYVPRSAINQLEMWQEATFDPVQIDKELAWAEAMGMNTMRVVGAFAKDDRVLAWDVWNEPGADSWPEYFRRQVT